MNYITHKQTLYVNSENRLSGSSSNFTYTFEIDNSVKYDRISVLDFLMPKSFYSVNSNNNTFNVEENSVQRIVTIPVGNYSRKSFKNVLQTQLNTNAHSGYTYTVTYDSSTSKGDTGKYTFSTETTAQSQPEFIFDNTNLTQLIGFNKNSTNIFNSNTLTSTNVVNFRPKNRIILKSSICQNYNNSTLASIINTSGDFDYISYQNQIPIESYKDFVKTESNIYTFTVLDEDLKEIDLNGLDISFTLLLWKENNISSLISDYIKMKVIKNRIKDL